MHYHNKAKFWEKVVSANKANSVDPDQIAPVVRLHL